MLSPFTLSMFISFGIVVCLFEKGNDFPVAAITESLRWVLGLLGDKWPGMLDCPVCLSMWAALASDIYVRLFVDPHYGPWILGMWPASGFAAMGITWTMYAALGPKQ